MSGWQTAANDSDKGAKNILKLDSFIVVPGASAFRSPF